MNAKENQAYSDGLDAQSNGAGKDANPHAPGSAYMTVGNGLATGS